MFTPDELKAIKCVERALKKLPKTVELLEIGDCVIAVQKGVHSTVSSYDFHPDTQFKVSGGGLCMSEMHDDELI